MSEKYDAIIIGGGPAGSTAAVYLARAGKRTLILERERFPRFHIGESLLPYNMPLFREMGFLPALREGGFMEKYGAQFVLPDGSLKTHIQFGMGKFTTEPMAYQVERSRFDEMLLRHAESRGAEVREGWAVKDYTIDPAGGVTVTAQNGGAPERFEADFLIDASGTANFTGNREGLKEIYESHRKVAIFGHYTGIALPEGKCGGDILIFRLKDAWFWFIPLSREKVSLGLVVDRAAFKESERSPEEIFDAAVERCPDLKARLANAERTGPMRTLVDFSYHNRRFTGDRLVRIGDAAAFLDPIFSSGVYLAMLSAKTAALAVADAIDRGVPNTSRMRRYEKRMRRYLKAYFEMIVKFYDQPFIELLFQPRNTKMHLPDAIVAILAGQLEGGWAVTWRLRFFFLLVKIQRRFPLVDRLSLE
ncbi:MAG: tryptophan 7-halogenase [Akkermansiaceae bacterium]|nr:tryptophan 7-halogenase [Akkermansiaceae bacterium]MCP5551770.1 tryptophan 7-halogenase [Akkermansiaceae bacterium]